MISVDFIHDLEEGASVRGDLHSLASRTSHRNSSETWQELLRPLNEWGESFSDYLSLPINLALQVGHWEFWTCIFYCLADMPYLVFLILHTGQRKSFPSNYLHPRLCLRFLCSLPLFFFVFAFHFVCVCICVFLLRWGELSVRSRGCMSGLVTMNLQQFTDSSFLRLLSLPSLGQQTILYPLFCKIVPVLSCIFIYSPVLLGNIYLFFPK